MIKVQSQISVIIPVFNEGSILLSMLQTFQILRRQGCELILVDGGSDHLPETEVKALTDQLIVTDRPQRALQMNAGAKAAKCDLLWFLHLDSQLPDDAVEAMSRYMGGAIWGRFDIKLSGTHTMLRVVERMINLRSRVTGIATGDQGIFVSRMLFERINGFPEIALMEDVALCSRLKCIVKPLSLRQRLVTSSRRWEQRGILKTILLMWWLRFAFALGANPNRLVNLYRPCSSPAPKS